MKRYLPFILIILVTAGIIALIWVLSTGQSSPKTSSDYYTDKQTGRQFFNDPNQNQENASYPNFMSITGGEELFNNVTSSQYNQIRSKLEFYFQTTVDPNIRTAHISDIKVSDNAPISFSATAGVPAVTVHVVAKSADYYNINLVITK